MPNRLARETSPYLLQHANNPVDWYPWGEEALGRARNEDKPILLSLGYSSCHWCHVMAHECFENESIARLMNHNFINIKVDREERPDLDHIYMEAVQAMTGSGGWPLTVFLTPEGKPFYGGTYFPPEDRGNHPGFPRVLKAAADSYHTRRSAIDQTICQITDMLSATNRSANGIEALTEDILKDAFEVLSHQFDQQNGGFGRAPKFPNPLTLEFLLRYYLRYKEKRALDMVDLTLEKMAKGGIYDQVGGGFHRYAMDNEWLYPHFEKMLYDNALLSRVYLHAYRATGKKYFAFIAEEILDYMLKEMRSPEGGFYCGLDADSEGEEGKYYLWTTQEVRESLKEQVPHGIENYFGMTEEGNFEGSNILRQTSEQLDPAIIHEIKLSLLKKRDQRIKPGRDQKVLASWNGLVLTSLAEASAFLGRPDYQTAAVDAGNFILNSMVSNGQLRHVYMDDQAKIDGFLDDYALVVEGLLSLHASTLDGKWLKTAISLTSTMIEKFLDTKSGILYDTSAGQKDLFIRPRNDFDGPLPCGVSAATGVLLKVARLNGDNKYLSAGEQALRSETQAMKKTPLGTSQWLCDLALYLAPPLEIAIIVDKDSTLTSKLANIIGSKWLPDAVVAARELSDRDLEPVLPIFEDRKMINGLPTVYICRNNTCTAPITDAKELEEKLREGR